MNRILRNTLIILLAIIIVAPVSYAQKNKGKKKPSKTHQTAKKEATTNPQVAEMNAWADSVMATLSLEEKIAQLMIVRVPTKMNDAKEKRQFDKMMKEYKPGGLCFFAGKAPQQLELTKQYQRSSRVPLFISIDGEWGLGMRLTDCYSFPRQMMFGALSSRNDSLITLMGNEVGIQCKKMGIHINYAPVADLNSNPKNPVIGTRSFGEDKQRVTRKAQLYAQAMQKCGIIAVAKHFPGHGDTDVDSHKGLPVINHTKAFVDSVDTYPFRRMCSLGVRGIMVAHVQMNAYDNRKGMPATTSEAIVTNLLRKEMGYKGLIITDGMDMVGLTQKYSRGEGELAALRAGVDILLLPADVEKSVNTIKHAAQKDKDLAKQIDERCHKVLCEKYKSGLNKLNLDKLSVPSQEDRVRCEKITERVASKALTLVRNEGFVLPIESNEQVAYFAIGNSDTAITYINDAIAAKLSRSKKVVLNLCLPINSTANDNYGVSTKIQDLIRQIVAFNKNTILVIYGNPYALQSFSATTTPSSPQSQLPAAIVMAYQNLSVCHKVVGDYLNGRKQFEGILPVGMKGYPLGTSLVAKPRPPKPNPYRAIAAMGMDSNCFKKIDDIANKGISNKAYPGCQILVARKGKVIYHKSYGHQTYDKDSAPIDTNTMFDLASVTKVTATTFAIMKLVDEKKINIDDKISQYVPYLKKGNKKNITIKEALSHYTKLVAFDNYYLKSDPKCRDLSLYSSKSLENRKQICEECRDDIMRQVAESKLSKDNKCVYSDLNFMLLAEVVRYVSGQTVDVFMYQQFYKPMGMKHTTYCPQLHGFDISKIAPTEDDKSFRHRLLRGEVHDQNASCMGGVSGHAGLFSNCSDLNKLFQLLLDNGEYKGHRYLSPEVIKTFSIRHFANKGHRRCLGFEKPNINGHSSHVANEASQSSFGHMGFTGTMVWIDPEYDLVYIFLSNRVHPNSSPNLLLRYNIRTDIQSLIYQSMKY